MHHRCIPTVVSVVESGLGGRYSARGFSLLCLAKNRIDALSRSAGRWLLGIGIAAHSLRIRSSRGPFTRAQALLILLMTVPLLSVLAGDAFAGYFVAARHFIWILPAAGVLAAGAIDRYKPPSVVLYALLGAVCIRQDVAFFTAPRENWDAAAAFLADQSSTALALPSLRPRARACTHFSIRNLRARRARRPEWHWPSRRSRRTNSARGIASLTSQGYIRQEEVVAGKSTILFFGHAP